MVTSRSKLVPAISDTAGGASAEKVGGVPSFVSKSADATAPEGKLVAVEAYTTLVVASGFPSSSAVKYAV